MVDTTTLIMDALDHIYRRYFQRTLPPNELRALIGTPLRSQIRIFGEPESFGLDEQTITEDFINFYESNRDRERILKEVTAVLIEGKQRGYPTSLVTSKNLEELANTLPRLGIAECVDFAITADDVTHPKPDPEGLLQALARLSIPSDQAVYIGDTIHDLRAARAAGVTAIGVTWGAATREQLAAEAPAHLCHTPEQLRCVLFDGD
jgi:HAD superfamily hydrolase (TIGR01549 family)